MLSYIIVKSIIRLYIVLVLYNSISSAISESLKKIYNCSNFLQVSNEIKGSIFGPIQWLLGVITLIYFNLDFTFIIYFGCALLARKWQVS